ncbi:MAG: helix-turn-helix domain-containing protein [Bacteroidales bacterium]|jgi:AraC-like DNA-binding protein|nr:helix-turn-helix domain-containing protein [Bacteroidales bacterium]
MEDVLQHINLKQLRSLFTNSVDSDLGDDFFVFDVSKYDDSMKMLRYPCRFEGYLAIFCLSGEVMLDVDLNTFEVKEHSLVINVPGNIVKVSEFNEDDPSSSHFIIVAMSSDFMSSIKMDFSRLFSESITFLDNPCITLSDSETDICYRYLDLISTILKNATLKSKKEVISGLISSVFYLLGSIWSRRIIEATRLNGRKSSTRAKIIFDQFIKLVTEYHSSERNMAFYAGKLCLTPKYLSKVITSISGRSAPDWIDSFVILEAKNMLKYSDMTIKGIVYKLHFVNQSVFYKFFKSHTGMTPSEYRNS